MGSRKVEVRVSDKERKCGNKIDEDRLNLPKAVMNNLPGKKKCCGGMENNSKTDFFYRLVSPEEK